MTTQQLLLTHMCMYIHVHVHQRDSMAAVPLTQGATTLELSLFLHTALKCLSG